MDEYACRLRIVRTRNFLTGKISSINGLGGRPPCTLAIDNTDGQSDRQGGDEDGEWTKKKTNIGRKTKSAENEVEYIDKGEKGTQQRK